MNKPSTNRNAAVHRQAGYISPERLTRLKMIFEAICDEVAIPSDAKVERDALATRILVACETVESEMMLFVTAMEAVADYRRDVIPTGSSGLGYKISARHDRAEIQSTRNQDCRQKDI
jgi:hypothetical protein